MSLKIAFAISKGEGKKGVPELCSLEIKKYISREAAKKKAFNKNLSVLARKNRLKAS